MTNSTEKLVERILPAPPMHWVGDGFPVSSILSPQSIGDRLSPFILFDYASPQRFEPSPRPRGVDTHPHRGFETVTLIFQGELEHRDSAGNAGSIGPGDVQWMTAASGVLHEEKHSTAFTRSGGVFEVAQLWVNLPAAHKMSAPRYQELRAAAIPTITLPNSAGRARLIAGDFGGTKGAARTFTPIILWDITLAAGASAAFPIPAGFNAAAFIRSGAGRFAGRFDVTARQLAVLGREGDTLHIAAPQGASLILLGGKPLDEPVAAYGPFVMNTAEEINQAVADFRSGKFGTLD